MNDSAKPPSSTYTKKELEKKISILQAMSVAESRHNEASLMIKMINDNDVIIKLSQVPSDTILKLIVLEIDHLRNLLSEDYGL